MRFTGKRLRLAEVAGLVGQAVAGKSTKKIFECLRLSAKDGILEVAGTDLEVAVRYEIREDIQVEEAGVAVVPAHLFANVLREIGDETVSIAVRRNDCSDDSALTRIIGAPSPTNEEAWRDGREQSASCVALKSSKPWNRPRAASRRSIPMSVSLAATRTDVAAASTRDEPPCNFYVTFYVRSQCAARVCARSRHFI